MQLLALVLCGLLAVTQAAKAKDERECEGARETRWTRREDGERVAAVL